MSNVIYLPGHNPDSPKISPVVDSSFFRPSSLAQMRDIMRDAASIEARTPTEAALAPFYARAVERDGSLPFIVRAKLSFAGCVDKLILPNAIGFSPTWTSLVRAPARGGLLSGRVVTKLTWVGHEANQPWEGLANPAGYARGAVLELCQTLRLQGCDLRLVKHLQLACRTVAGEDQAELNQLELTLVTRQR